MKAINIFCITLTKIILAIADKIFIVQVFQVSLCTHEPFIQKYAASIDVKKSENGLSDVEFESKSVSTVISSNFRFVVVLRNENVFTFGT